MRISDWSSDLCSSDLFKTSEGREGTVLQLRHKYVARMHFVMENYETRFPTVFWIKQIAFDPEKEGGLDQILEELKARREWVAAEIGKAVCREKVSRAVVIVGVDGLFTKK